LVRIVIAMLLALVIASAASLPTSVQHALLASATPSPAPSPNVPCEGRCLSGIAVGDDAKGVLARLDSRPIPGSDQRIMADFNSYPDGLMLTVYYYRGTVVAVFDYLDQNGRADTHSRSVWNKTRRSADTPYQRAW
jgi:hypothetical protein